MTNPDTPIPAYGDMPIPDGFGTPRAVILSLKLPKDQPLEVELPMGANPLDVFPDTSGGEGLIITVFVHDAQDLQPDSTTPKTLRYFAPVKAAGVVNLPEGYAWAYLGSAWVPELIHVFERK